MAKPCPSSRVVSNLCSLAANAALANPLKAMWVALRGVRTTGTMAPEINLANQRPAQYIFSSEVQKRLSR